MGFIVLAIAVGVAACTSIGNTTNLNIGPSFPSLTLYGTNSNQNAVEIYLQGQASGTGPKYNIGGSATRFNGPQYLAFDVSNNLWVTNFNPSVNAGALIEIEALATGNVLPISSFNVNGHPSGIAITPTVSTKPSATPQTILMAVSDLDTTYTFPSSVLLYNYGQNTPYTSIAGSATNLNVPSGLALDSSNDVFVANIQGKNVVKFVLPTPSPTPKPTPTPSGSPSPTPTASATTSPTPSTSPTPMDLPPTVTISGGATEIVTPTSVALDRYGRIYISDQGAPRAHCSSQSAAAILIFPPNVKGAWGKAPIGVIRGCNTKLLAPTDVKIDSSGNIFVADSTASGGGVIYKFGPSARGNVGPKLYYKSPGAVTGIGIVP